MNPRPSLVLCALGVRPPASMTLAAAETLRGCDVVFVSEPHPQLARALALLCRDVQTLPAEDAAAVELVSSALARGKRAAYAAAGQPLCLGPLAQALRRRADAAKVPCSTVAGTSMLLEQLAQKREVLGYGEHFFKVYEKAAR